jgi:hypothetical protein
VNKRQAGKPLPSVREGEHQLTPNAAAHSG